MHIASQPPQPAEAEIIARSRLEDSKTEVMFLRLSGSLRDIVRQQSRLCGTSDQETVRRMINAWAENFAAGRRAKPTQ